MSNHCTSPVIKIEVDSIELDVEPPPHLLDVPGFSKTEQVLLVEPVLKTETVIEDSIEIKYEPLTYFSSDSDLAERQVNAAALVRPCICPLCHTGFPNTDLFELHLRTEHNSDRPYSCKHCKKPFRSLDSVRVHETIHNPHRFKGPPTYLCPHCPKAYHLNQSLSTHIQKYHRGYKPPKRPRHAPIIEHHSTKGIKNPKPYRKPPEIFPCAHCDLKFPWKSSLKRHMRCHIKERPHPCPICQQPFSLKTDLKVHIQRVHVLPTPTGATRPRRPRWKKGQPCPCQICGKVFPTPGRLETHTRLHTGDKPFSCKQCSLSFRISYDLLRHVKRMHTDIKSNPLKLYKCRVCGKNDFTNITGLRQHRRKTHSHIPYETEKEMAFACGICGKPWFLREEAIICAALRHNPESLQKSMFKIKCPECPDEMLGFRNLRVLRDHWSKEHKEKFLPVIFRRMLYDDPNGKEDKLPKCTMDVKTAQNWRDNGIPEEILKRKEEFLVELPLLPMTEEERFRRKKRQPREVEEREYICEICKLKVSCGSNLERHVQIMHCDKANKEKVEGSKKADIFSEGNSSANESVNKCRYCSKRFKNLRAVKTHEGRVHGLRVISNSSEEKYKGTVGDASRITVSGRVNVTDTDTVARILDNKFVTVSLQKLKMNCKTGVFVKLEIM